MPIKTYWCAALIIVVLTLSSFTCSKSSDNVTAREQTNNLIVDFRDFPACSIFTLYGNENQGTYRFDSDSLKYYTLEIPGGKYKVEWRLVNLASDAMYKAKWLNSNAGTSVPWETAMYTYENKYIHGSYTFTRVRK